MRSSKRFSSTAFVLICTCTQSPHLTLLAAQRAHLGHRPSRIGTIAGARPDGGDKTLWSHRLVGGYWGSLGRHLCPILVWTTRTTSRQHPSSAQRREEVSHLHRLPGPRASMYVSAWSFRVELSRGAFEGSLPATCCASLRSLLRRHPSEVIRRESLRSLLPPKRVPPPQKSIMSSSFTTPQKSAEVRRSPQKSAEVLRSPQKSIVSIVPA